MQSATALIDSFIKVLSDSNFLSDTCKAIRAYEEKNLPKKKKNKFSL